MSRKFIDARNLENIGDGVLIENGRITIVYAGVNRFLDDGTFQGIEEFEPYKRWKDLATDNPAIRIEIDVEYEEITFSIFQDGLVEPIGRVNILLILLNKALKPK